MKKWLKRILVAVLIIIIIAVVIVVVTLIRYRQKEYKTTGFTETVHTECGVVRGEVLDNGTERWLGIPYAAAPVGELRFKAPQTHEGWSNVLDVVEMRADPMQANALNDDTGYSEDCLYMNVYRPESDKTDLPVLVFIYGGSYDSGGASGYHFEAMAKETNAIIVTFNYRVSAFGFLNFSDLSDRFDDNIGLKDIIFALRWVHENISAFGGDADNVTIWGQSAGAGAVSVMLQNNEARGCFQKAIIMSNCWESYYTEKQAQDLRDLFLDQLGISADDVDSLLEMDAETLLESVSGLEGFNETGTTLFCPVYDGEIFDTAPLQADLSDIDIPIMVGTTNNEATLFLGFAGEGDIKEMTDGAAILQNVDHETQEAIFSTYAGYPSKGAAEEILTDLMYKIPASRYADRYSAGAPVYFYRYDAYPFPMGLIGLKSFHACDLLMLCGTIPTEKAGHIFTQYIGNFIKNGDPNGEGVPEWRVYSPDKRNMMVIDKTPAAALNLYGDKLAKYDGIEYLLVKQPQ